MLLGVIVAVCTIAGGSHRTEASASRKPTPVRPDVKTADARIAVKSAEVIGRVVDALGQVVGNTTVIATPANPSASALAPRTHSDHLGRFHFVGLPPGDYIFVALHGEHAPSVSPVMPVAKLLEVVLVVGDAVISA